MKKKTLAVMIGSSLMGLTGAAISAAQSDGPLLIRPVQQQPESKTVAPKGDRLIVKFRNAGSTEALTAGATLRSAATRAGVMQKGKIGLSGAQTLGFQRLRRGATGAVTLRTSRRLSTVEMQDLLTELRADPSVAYAEVDTMLRPVKDLSGPGFSASPVVHTATANVSAQAAAPNDPRYADYQWHLQDGVGGINAPEAWDKSTGKGVVVAVLDTGILPNHPDLKATGHLLKGYDFISDKTVSRRDSDDRVAGAQDYGDWTEANNECALPAEDSSWHGSHTAGTVGELTNNGIGGAGAAYDALILPVRVLGRCGGYTSDISDAIIWASGGHVEGVADNTNPAEVISLSLGERGSCSTATQDAINIAVTKGSVVVVAAGNNAANASQFNPASCDNVITVGATRKNGSIAYYSNYGTAVDLSGPGGGADEDTGNGGWDGMVLSVGYTGKTTPTSGDYAYAGKAGTSMATPHVAAIVALVQSALAANGKNPLSPSDMEALLKKTANPFGVAPPSTKPIGAGIANAAQAVKVALQGDCTPGEKGCDAVVLALTNKMPRTNLSDTEGREAYFSYNAKVGTILSILTYAGNGNVQLYAKAGKIPSSTSYDARSVKTGTTQTIRFTAPKAGTYYIKLVGGDGGYRNASLMARQ